MLTYLILSLVVTDCPKEAVLRGRELKSSLPLKTILTFQLCSDWLTLHK